MLLSGCATVPVDEPMMPTAHAAIPPLQGSYHAVQRGETMWRIARAYGLDADALASANRLTSASPLRVGQRLFIPLPAESARFLWPVRGALRMGGGSHGIEIAAPEGSLVRASRSGRVAVATRQLSGWGTTVILDHLDGYLTIYSGLDHILVSPGAALRQGVPIGTLGSSALHFEIRYGNQPKNVLALLPRE